MFSSFQAALVELEGRKCLFHTCMLYWKNKERHWSNFCSRIRRLFLWLLCCHIRPNHHQLQTPYFYFVSATLEHCKDNRQGKTSILWTYVLYCIVVSCYIVLLLHGPPNSGIPWETKPNYYYDMWNRIWDAQLLMWLNGFLVIICEVHALVVSISECEKIFWNYVYIQKVKMNF